MPEKKVFTSIDEYIGQYPEEIQLRLTEMRNVIKKAAPTATEKISWAMPTFYLNGNLVHFAFAKNHIGFYPAPSAIEKFAKELEGYKTSKGAVQFPHSEKLPVKIIDKMVRFRVGEQEQQKQKK